MDNKYQPLATSNLIVGRGSINFIGQLAKKRAAVIYDGRATSEAIKVQLKELITKNGGECLFIADIKNEPYFNDILRYAEEMKSYNPDLIIAIGGGSVMDTAKAMHLFYENPDMSIEESLRPFALPKLGKKAIMVAIPTTSGTGSETTSVAVFIDQKDKSKHIMISNELIPAYAIIDANFADTLPKTVAAHTGMDALTHSLEAAVCVAASPMVRSIALGAALDILENLVDSVAGIDECKDKARETCHVAATLAGVAITNSCAGLAHGFDQPGAYFGIPHGLVCGLLLPYTTAFTGPHPSYTVLAKRLGLQGPSERDYCQSLADYLVDFNTRLSLPISLAEAGIAEKPFMEKVDDFAGLALMAMATKLSPRIPTLEEAKELLKNCYYGKKPVVK